MTCKDCLYFLAVDAFKGMCKRDQAKITQESNTCGHFEKVPKCKFCTHYTPGKEFAGLCMEKVPAYPDLMAVNCPDFSWIGKN